MSHPTQRHGPEPVSVADVVERLFTDFESDLTLPAIHAVVRQCRRDLDSIPATALPELLERLARQRLHDMVTETRSDIPSTTDADDSN
jgi:hypothetical protein